MIERKRRSVCEKVNVLRSPPAPGSKLGVAQSTFGRTPVHGLRHPPTDATSGWYLWCGGEISDDPDFFVPLHVERLAAYLTSVVEDLDLPPGYRFLVDGAQFEDLWFDAELQSRSRGARLGFSLHRTARRHRGILSDGIHGRNRA